MAITLLAFLFTSIVGANDAMDRFGQALATGDGYLFVGESGGFQTPGTVHIYVQGENGGWILNNSLQGLDAHVGDGFGANVDYDNGVLAVADGSKIYLFSQEDGDTEFTLSDLIIEDTIPNFGRGALSFDSGWLAVGTSLPNGSSGRVVLYSINAQGEGVRQTQLDEPSEYEASQFGVALSIDDATLLVGAPGACAAYLYAIQSDQWELSTILPCGDDLSLDSMYGMTLDLSGDHAVIGAVGHNYGAGAVAVWHRKTKENSSWERVALMSSEDQQRTFLFGSQIQILHSKQVALGVPWRLSIASAEPNVRLYSILNDGFINPQYDILPEIIITAESKIMFNDGVLVIGRPTAAYGEGSADLLAHRRDSWEVIQELFYASGNISRKSEVSCDEGIAGQFDCGLVDLVSFLPNDEMGMNRGVRLNDVWGWEDPVTGVEYGIIGHMEGTVFIDLSDPAHPKYLGTLPRTEGAPGSTWRDIKVFQDHAFIVADRAQEHGMQIFDLTQLRDLTDVPVEFTTTAHYDLIHSAHNIVINEETGYAYVVGASGGGETCGGALHMIDIREPQSPIFVGCFADETTGRSKTGYSHDAQCVIYNGPDSKHAGQEICFSANETAISIVDVTNKENPIAIATGSYPHASYVHQGWLSEDQSFFFQNDELDEISGRIEKTRTIVWDVRELSDPIMIHELYGPTSATDHNLYVHGDLMYQTNNSSGLRIIDVSSPEDPREIGFFDTTPYGNNDAGFNGTWSSYPYFESGMIIVTSRREGLFILKKQSVDI